ncbi:1786_t:CDS:2 [Entrophospora sp. SA101]|nr:1786_t:CDS:2 [Entrophospora sp. SA101]
MATPQHINLLIRIDELCKDWSSSHKRSCMLFSSNVTDSMIFQHEILTSIIYKQSCEIENLLCKLHHILNNEFEEILKSMQTIQLQIEKIFSSLFYGSSSKNVTPPSSSSSAKKQKKSQKSNQNKKPISTKKSKPKSNNLNPTSNNNDSDVNDVADISLSLSHYYINCIVDIYEQEMVYKRAIILGGALKLEESDEDVGDLVGSVKKVVERWSVQQFLRFEIEEEMVDRIKLWKKVKEYDKRKEK